MTAQNRIGRPAPSRALTLACAAAACAGIPALWLPFVDDESPLSVVVTGSFADVIWLALPCFLAPLIVILLFRWIATGRVSRAEQAVGWAAAIAAAALDFVLGAIMFGGIREALTDGTFWPSVLLASGFAVLPGLGLWLAFRRRRAAGPPAAATAMAAVYAVNAIGSLWIFIDFGYQAGAYCTIAAAAALLVHVASALIVPARLAAPAAEAHA